jgi:hypothetical protein
MFFVGYLIVRNQRSFSYTTSIKNSCFLAVPLLFAQLKNELFLDFLRTPTGEYAGVGSTFLTFLNNRISPEKPG